MAPFVWTQQDGLEVIPENGQAQDYDRSVALGISDDGNVVVGSFLSSVIFQGEPPTLGRLIMRMLRGGICIRRTWVLRFCRLIR